MSPRIAIIALGWAVIGGLALLERDLPPVSRSEDALVSFDAVDRIGIPMQMMISAIGVDAPVIPVGVTAEKKMQIPKAANKLGWFSPGVRPGEQGNAVITGHLDTVLGTSGVFFDLKRLQPGDLIRIVDDGGRTRTFQVTKLRSYPRDKAPVQDIFGPSDGYHLNLITCRGQWETALHSYNERLVVFADLVEPNLEKVARQH